MHRHEVPARPDRSAQPQSRAKEPPAAGDTSADWVQSLQGRAGNTAVSRAMEVGSQEAVVQRSSVPDVLRSPGRPLEESVRADMEARLGADFGNVRVHTGAAAQRSATEIGARAYTSGEHVVLGAAGGDRHTLAHELTHVIQQRSGPVSGTVDGSGLKVSHPSDAFERAAEANAHRVLQRSVPDRSVPARSVPDDGRAALWPARCSGRSGWRWRSTGRW